MAVNVLLPFCAARGSASGESQLRKGAVALYRSWSALPENEISREVSLQLGIGGGNNSLGPITARRQQGMIHLYRQQGRALDPTL